MGSSGGLTVKQATGGLFEAVTWTARVVDELKPPVSFTSRPIVIVPAAAYW
jgi:hypothetical protein